MTKRNKHIDTYKTVYGVDLVVANKYVTLEDLKKKYTKPDGEELDDNYLDSIAITGKCLDKKTNRSVSLVVLCNSNKDKEIDKKLDLINTAAHEAAHVCLDIYQYIAEYNIIESQEPFCYLLGWATANIYKTWTKK